MYLAIVSLLMFVLPIGSIAWAVGFGGMTFSPILVGQWFVFWSVGVRLVMAGVRQIFQPSYTSEVILGLKHKESHLLVRELGFANLSIGLVGVGSALFPAWLNAGALGGAVFYLLAGINHLFQSQRGKHQRIAMVSDVFVGTVLLLALAALIAVS